MPFRTPRLGLDVTLAWGDDPLSFRRVDAGSLALGDLGDLPLPPGAEPSALIAHVACNQLTLFVPRGVVATVERAEDGREPLEGPAVTALVVGDRAVLVLGALRLHVVASAREVLSRDRLPRPGRGVLGFVVAAAAHALLFYRAVTVIGPTAHEAEEARTDTLRRLLAAAPMNPSEVAAVAGVEAQRASGAPAADDDMPAWRERNRVRDPFAKVRERRSSDSGDPSTARGRHVRDARSFGMLSIWEIWSRPPPPFIVPPPTGTGPLGGSATLWESDLGSVGGGALALSGVGEGGGRSGAGVAVGEIGGGALAWTHDAPARPLPTSSFAGSGGGPNPRPDTAEIEHLAASLVERVVRQNTGRFQSCAPMGREGLPALVGEVTVELVVGADGAVVRATGAGSSLPEQVTACVVRAVRGLSFARHEGGSLAVTTSIVVAPPS